MPHRFHLEPLWLDRQRFIHVLEQRQYVDGGVTEGIAAAGIAVSIASAAAASAAAYQQAQNQKKAADYNAQVQANNAQVQAYQRQQQDQEYATQALLAEKQGAQTTSQIDLRNNVLVAKNVDAALSSGLQISGSTQDAITGSAYNDDLLSTQNQYKTQLDAYQARIGAANASYNSTIAINADKAQATLFTSSGQAATQTAGYSILGDAISGAGKAGQSASFFD